MTGRLRRMVRAPGLLASLLALLTVLVLVRGERDIGYVRDEGIYFEASRRYAAWVVRWVEHGAEANTPAVRDRYFGFNHEHPALMKTAAGLSARLFAIAPDPEVVAELEHTRSRPGREFQTEIAAVEGGVWPLLREGTAMRLPAILLTGFAVALLFLAGRRLGHGKLAGLLAAGWFVLLPHVQFHASLHAFDMPIAVLTLAVALVWLRALRDWRFGLLLGPLLGIAIAVKHNALFLGPLLTLHLWVLLGLHWRRTGECPRLRQWLGLPLWSMALLGPLTAIALWPWLWDDTLIRIGEYFAFHGEHSYYNTEFLGTNYNRPPLPISYPFVMTWATVPSVLLVLMGIGALAAVRTSFGRRIPPPLGQQSGNWRVPFASTESTVEPLLYLILASFPILLIAWPTIPIFGGTKHWLTAYPFMALLAAFAWGRLWLRARGLLTPWPRLVRVAPTIVLITVLIPSAWSTVHGHPFNLSQYSPLAGGTRGAARMGLPRGFWGHAVVPILAEGNELVRGPVQIHDIHRLAVDQYRREGRWPDWQPANTSRASAGLLFPEQHMLSDEIELWDQLGTVEPSAMLTLDDVPLVLVYRRTDALELFESND